MSAFGVDHAVRDQLAQASAGVTDAIKLVRLHALAQEGALAGVSALHLAGEDVRGYFSSVTDNLERIDAALWAVERELQLVVQVLHRGAAADECSDADDTPTSRRPTERRGVMVRLHNPPSESPA